MSWTCRPGQPLSHEPVRRVLAIALVALALVMLPQIGAACVGKRIIIGVEGVGPERLIAELIVVLLNERTGTTIEVKTYADSNAIYEAATHGEVGILIEDSRRALERLGVPAEAESTRAYELAKTGYRKRLDLLWIDPFAELEGEGGVALHYGPVLTTEVTRSFPALPRVVNKLARVLGAEDFAVMMARLKDGGDLRIIARDFLRAKRLI